MVLTCPLSCPLGLVLDLALRRDISTCGVRERAMEMIRTNVNDPYRYLTHTSVRPCTALSLINRTTVSMVIPILQ